MLNLPDWPMLMDGEMAGAYLGMGKTKFYELAQRESVLRPVFPFGRESDRRWHRRKLDEWADEWADSLLIRASEEDDIVSEVVRARRERRASRQGRGGCSGGASAPSDAA